MILRSSSSRARRANWMSTIAAMSSRRSRWNRMISSTRFRNSGRKWPRTTPITSSRTLATSSPSFCRDRYSDPRFEVMMISTLRKSTVRPCPSVSRPSSSTCKQDVEHVRMRLLDLVEQHHLVGPPPHRLGQRPALLVADIARRRTDQPGDRVLLHIFGHVDAHERGVVVEQEARQRLGQLGLADARSDRGT